MEILYLDSNAKINIGLNVTGLRDDGYHNIETIFQEIDLCDHITFTRTGDSVAITSKNPNLPLGKQNLMYKAFMLFRSRASVSGGLSIAIDKRIPMGGGLGGGSSNAAATLIAANILWGKPFSVQQLQEMAFDLGSDVPFFVRGGTAIGRGRGEDLTDFDFPEKWFVVLVCPGINISTAWAYKEFKFALTNDKKITNFNALFSGLQPDKWQEYLSNDLEKPVFGSYPELKKIKDLLYENGAFYASMSGSGSTIYGLFTDKEAGIKAGKFFSKKYESYVCRPITNRLRKNMLD